MCLSYLGGNLADAYIRSSALKYPVKQSVKETEEQVPQVSVTIQAKSALALTHPATATGDVSSVETQSRFLMVPGTKQIVPNLRGGNKAAQLTGGHCCVP